MTTVTKDVIRDLLPVYVSGEATADTKRLVEEFLATDPELRSLAQAAAEVQLPPAVAPSGLESMEMRALDYTRSLLTRKMWLFAASLFFSVLPMAFAFDGHRLTFLMARDHPAVALPSLIAALAGWAGFLSISRRLSMTGMEPPPTRLTHFWWVLTGALLGASITVMVYVWLGNVVWRLAITPVCVLIAASLRRLWRSARP